MNIHTNPVLPEAPTDPAAEVFATRGEARGTGGLFRIESRERPSRQGLSPHIWPGNNDEQLFK